MKWMRISVLLSCLIFMVFSSSFELKKKKKFIDFFTTLKGDSLFIASPPHDQLTKADVAWEMKGSAIDTSFSDVYSREEADDLQYYLQVDGENSTFGYYKVKLDLGYYLVIIRAAGEYWNSRMYACLYHSGENKITQTVLIGEDFGDAGAVFTCNSVLRKQNGSWIIMVHEYFSEPVDEYKYIKGVDLSREVRTTDITYSLSNADDRYSFVETDRKDKKEVVK